MDRKIQPNSDSVLNFYSNGLGLTNSLRRVAPENSSPKKSVDDFSIKNIPVPFTDPSIVRSEQWSSADFVKSSKKRRWIPFKSKFMSCIK